MQPKARIDEIRTKTNKHWRGVVGKFTGLYPWYPSADLSNTEQDDQELATAMVLSHKAARINQRAGQ